MLIYQMTENDIDNFLPLLAELGYPATTQDFMRRYNRFVATPGYGIAVCEIKKELAGFVAWSKSFLLVSDAASDSEAIS